MKKFYLPFLMLFSLAFTGMVNAQFITTIAGTGNAGYNGDNIAATIAQLNQSSDVKVDATGNVYIADWLNHRVRKIGTNGFISTIAGTGNTTYNGDNIAGTAASLYRPEALAFDVAGNLLIEDTYHHLIRKLSANGFITTIAGNGVGAYNGDNILATNASLNYPSDGVLADAAGNVFISDTYNNRIRKVNVNGIITTIAGTGAAGYNGDNIAATSASINYPYALALDAVGNLYFADGFNHRVRKISTSGIITTVAGTGVAGYNGDNIAATSANLNLPEGIAFDAAGNLYISDYLNNRIRKVNVTTGLISTVVGTGTSGYNGDNIPATLAQLYAPVGITFDAAGNLFIADFGNSRIRKVTSVGSPLPLSLTRFTAQLQNGAGLLQWQTSNEINTQNFVVESGKDGISFSELGTVKANTTAGSNSYSFTDATLKSTSYYRLKMVDKDGKITYSNTVTIKMDVAGVLLNLYPNPAGNIVHLSFSTSAAGKYIVQIADVSGKVIRQVNVNAVAGTNKQMLDLHNFVAGTYVLSILNHQKVEATVQFLKN